MRQKFHFRFHPKPPKMKCAKCQIIDYRERFSKDFHTTDNHTGMMLGRCRFCQILKWRKRVKSR